MSKTGKKVSKAGKKENTSDKIISILIAIVLMALSLTVLVVYSTKNDALEKEVGAHREEILNRIEHEITNINKNGYIQVMTGDSSFEAYLFNSKGEAIAQGSDTGVIVVYRNDGKSIRYSDLVEYGYDISVMGVLNSAIRLAKENKAYIAENSHNEEDEDGFEKYYIIVEGFENIRGMYSDIGDEFADSTVSRLKESVGDGASDVKYVFTFILGQNGELGVACEIEYDEQKLMVWYFDGYTIVYDWELSENWYSYDFENMDDTEEAENMITDLLFDLDVMFEEYLTDME